ncbi:MAG: transglutaminase domain-containing protein [Lachnospiraceae bacterium]|nr:transglutaminase domain-containing protein [Lachnospiraceae bacterium]
MMAVLYDLLYMVPLLMMASVTARNLFGAPEKGLGYYFVALLILGCCVMIKHWKNRLKFLAPGVMLALGLGIVLIQGPDKREDYLYANQWVLWVGLTAIACFFVGWVIAQNTVAKRIMAATLFIGLLVIMGVWNNPPKMAVAWAMFLLVCFLAEEVQKRWNKSGYVDGQGHLVSISPFLLALCFFVFVLPASEYPYDWNFAVKLWERATSIVKITSKWAHSGDEDYGGVIGFSDNGSFWGNIKHKEKDMMYLSGTKDVGVIVYLTGKVMDDFDGRTWEAKYEAENRDRMMDTLETLCAVTKYDPEYVRNYLWKVQIWLWYEDFNTKYLFTPIKSILGNGKIGEQEFVQRGGSLESLKKLGYSTEYDLSFFKMNLGHAQFQEFLRNAPKPDPESWEITRNQYEPTDPYWEKNGKQKNAGTSYEDYLAYVERIHKYYLPQTKVSDRVAPYLEQWLDGAESDYDKLCRIESVLSKFTYTESPGDLPEKVTTPEEFLDYFLLESQEGYCSYFATAFVLLARSQGIPARYVQGFYVPKYENETVAVRSSMSHAWPEAYVEGVGWIPFEPTPGKKSVASWKFVKKATGTGPGMTEPEREEEEEETVPPEKEQEQKTFVIHWEVILIPLGLVVAFLLAFLLVDRALSRARYRKLDETGKFKAICKKNLRVLGMIGLKLEQGETLEEFGNRALETVPKEGLGFLADSELVAYAGQMPDEKMRRNAEADLEVLMGSLKASKGKLFFWYRFLIRRS